MKWIVLLLLTISCSTYHIPKTVDEIPDIQLPGSVTPTTNEPVEVVVEFPKSEEHIVKLNIVKLTGFSATQEARFRKIVSNVQTVINTQEYKDTILNFTYNSKKAFVDNKGDSNEVVLQKILSKDWPIEYKLEYIAKIPFKALTVGYTYPNVTWVVINSKIFDSYDDGDIACNILHEMGGHKIGGYDHAMSWSASRDYSVPYGMSYAAEKIYRKMFMTK